MDCCHVLKTLFSLVKNMFLLVLLWDFYSHLINTYDVTDWFKHTIYGILMFTSVLVLFSMVCDICCCTNNDEKDIEADFSHDRDASKGCCKVFCSLVKDISLLELLWYQYSVLTNTDDFPDWYKQMMYCLIVLASFVILLSMIHDICCWRTHDKEIEKEETATNYNSSDNSEVVIDIISDLL